MRASRQVVISGAGVVSPFGEGLARFFDALAAGGTAVGPLRSFESGTFPTRVAGEVPPLSAGPRALLREWRTQGAERDRKTGFAWRAAREAWDQAGAAPLAERAWLCLGLGLEQAFLEDFAPYHRGEAGIDWERILRDRAGASPDFAFRSEVDLPARLLAHGLGLGGPVLVNASACAAGTMAVAEAAAWIRRGRADAVVCGGADSMVNPLGVGGMSRLGAPSPRATADACRPFDRKRDGLAMGEGAAIFVLETEAQALARGVRPLARVLGWGVTQDGYRVTAPRPDGAAAARAMRQALEMSGRGPAEVGYLNAHGTGTPLNDPAESRAIREVFGAARPRVSSIKGAVGHLMAASGALELAACLLPFARGILPGTAHLESLDPECDLNVIGPRPVHAEVDAVMSNSFGFGGQNASVVLGRYAP